VLFASRLALRTRPEQVHTYPDRDTDSSAEAASLRLLYRGVPLCAVGHGVDAVLTRTPAGDEVATEALPVARVISTTPDVSDESGSLAVDMEELGDWDPAAVGTVERMIAGYHAWVAGRWRKAQAELSGDALRTATAHLQACDSFAADMAAGWQLALDAPDTVGRCLRWTSTMMAAQRRSYAAATRPAIIDERSGTARFDGPEPASSTCPARWRPFQLAFLLANLAPVVDDSHPRRGVVDVIWMPTGGGKTEAYLALAAFTMLHRRLCASLASRRDAGTAVVMRYTLRLLTAQQVQRAASLICAMERLRANHPDLLGKNRFTIGAWLGTSSTPNHRKDALAQLRKYATKRSTIRPFLLSRCPACAAAMGDLVPKLKTVLGYGEQSTASGPRMRAACPNPACAFSAERTPAGLPVYEVDEDIYAHPPTFVVATVDKFAQMSWNERPRALFGLDGDGRRARRAPELVIQDELHLISGPLGSLVGLYESALAQLFAHDGGVRPHVVAATATTRAYARQSAALYACPREQVRLVPPPELDVDESFFARANTGVPARAFVGVCATGAGRFQQVQMRVLAGLAHAAVAILAADPGAPVDPYWTDVAFFGSLRDLGQAKSLIATDLRGYQWRLVRATGIRTGTLAADGTRRAIRNLSDVELTSSSSTSASEALEKLSRPRGSHGAVDLALATSVIEVGVDVDRLGLLTIVRQPKTASQYIQVAGRVGRDARSGPGLVVVLLNPLASRDVSHYERFTAVHRRLYAAVEPATVTPFTDAALSRGLRGTLASVVRQTRPAGSPAVDSDDAVRADRSAAALAARAVELYGTEAGSRVDAHHQEAADELAAACREQLEWGRAGRGNRGGAQFLRGLETPAPAMTASWAVLTSLRNVDPDAALRIDDAWLPFTAAGTPPGPAGVAAGDTEEEW
jgi:Helicase conserved C-terminal domain